MPVKLTVGPPVLTVHHDLTVMVTDLGGEIHPLSEQGVFCGDTRFVSRYEITANGQPWQRLTSSATAYDTARIVLTNPALAAEQGDIPAGTLLLTSTRVAVRFGIHTHHELTNHGLTPAILNFAILFDTDFADIFEVKSHRYLSRGHIESEWEPTQRELRVTYTNRDFRRVFTHRTLASDSPPGIVSGRITYEVALAPRMSWHSCTDLNLDIGQPKPMRPPTCYFKAADRTIVRPMSRWKEEATTLSSSYEDLRDAYRQSVEDIEGLRMHSYDMQPDMWLPAAGVPWFVAIFGRDSLIASLQSMVVHPIFARGALAVLAQYQATERDDFRDAQPGKILHELRMGELTHARRLPFSPYYGTWDATTLFLIALHEAWTWLGDESLLREHWTTALRCLDWIDLYGDLDGDGFQEYQSYSPVGYENMGWKDAADAVVYPDGSQVKQPKALCELQGYVFDAWLRMAEVCDVLGEPGRATELRQKAAAMQARFDEQFWCEDIGFYAFGLDPDKKPIKTIASNPGHCLLSGIARPARAAQVVQRLFQPDMWSGWGIRTLSSQNPAYNPASYQCGSVWPHDNGVIALGFKRYGFADEAARVAHDVVDAARNFVSYRLPELYAGIERAPGMFPVQYLQANVPQAWAAGSIFHFVQAILGLRADAPHNRLFVNPQLPEWLPDVTLQRLKVGGSTLDLRFWREGERTRWDITSEAGTIQVEQQAWQPWQIEDPVDRQP